MARKLGTIGRILDADELAKAVAAVNPALTPDGPQMLLNTAEGIAVVCTEGVGCTEVDGEVAIYCRPHEGLAFYVTPVDVPVSVIAGITTTPLDLAEHVRVFGGRLETNFRIWQREAESASQTAPGDSGMLS